MHNADAAAEARQRIEAAAIKQVLQSSSGPTSLPPQCVVYVYVKVRAHNRDALIDYALRDCRFRVDVRSTLLERGVDLLDEHWAAAYFDPEKDQFVICGGNAFDVIERLKRKLGIETR